MTWLVVHTKARAELEAKAQLANQGYEVFLPQIRERKRRSNRWQWVTSPLFPRYLFVNVPLGEQDVSPIRSTVGVTDIVRFGQSMASVSDVVINYLQDRQDAEVGAQQVDEWSHQPGDNVQILEGPFAGLAAVYQLNRGEDRAMVLVELLGREASITVPHEAIGPPL